MMTKTATFRPMRMLGQAAAVIVLLSVALVGWRTISGIPVSTIAIHGLEHAAESEILALARIPQDSSLMSVEASIVADRVRRHPWVRSATVSRLPTGTVSVRVTEREPVLLALSDGGTPAYYVDAQGYRMPYEAGTAYPVPILTGLDEAYHPVTPIRNPAVTDLARALVDIDEDVDALLSEFEVQSDGGLVLRTAVAPGGRALSVRLGDARIADRLERLRAFWDQVVLARPDVRFTWVDLRFDSQIVTRETS